MSVLPRVQLSVDLLSKELSVARPELTNLNNFLRRITEQVERLAGVVGTVATVGSIDHGGLIGLADDDHPQYLRTDGTRTLGGNMAALAGVTYDGVDVSTLLPVDEEALAGARPGVVFTCAFLPIAGSMKVYLNGQRLRNVVDYTLVGAVITITSAPIVAGGGVLATDELIADYRRAAA